MLAKSYGVTLAWVAVISIISNGWVMQANAQDSSEDPPVEWGHVRWERDFEAAVVNSKKSGKPIFVQFQEVPGCATCRNFAQDVLTHPLMVEAVEDLFVPVMILNNQKGKDEQVLKRFNEPAWNNPVVRFLDPQQKELLPRQDRIWKRGTIASRMVHALKKAGRDVPPYLLELADDRTFQTATFAMHCYWVGEARLGAIDGVVETHSAWKSGREVVQLQFDPAKVSYLKLVSEAMKFECASAVFTHDKEQLEIAKELVHDRAILASTDVRDAKLSDQSYYLRNSILKFVPLTRRQATKLNSVLYIETTEVEKRARISKILSPRQRKIFQKVESRFRSDRETLRGLVWPHDDDELANYQAKLLKRLEE